MPTHPFSQVDVFTDALTLGNPVAVVHDADDLTEDQMRAIARWTNLSETTFLLRPTLPGADYRVRIFTTGEELPFAGHPTLGTARAWLDRGGVPGDPAHLVQECAIGRITVRTSPRLAFAAPPPLRTGPVDTDDLAELVDGLGLEADDVVDSRWCDNGPGWVGLLLRDAETVLRVDRSTIRFGTLDKVGLVGPQPPGSETDFEVRAFFPDEVGEDPVTGSLNAAVAQWLMATDRAPDRYVASQGTALQRRGRVHVERDGDVVWVGGDVAAGVSGTLAV